MRYAQYRHSRTERARTRTYTKGARYCRGWVRVRAWVGALGGCSASRARTHAHAVRTMHVHMRTHTHVSTRTLARARSTGTGYRHAHWHGSCCTMYIVRVHRTSYIAQCTSHSVHRTWYGVRVQGTGTDARVHCTNTYRTTVRVYGVMYTYWCTGARVRSTGTSCAYGARVRRLYG